MTKRKSKTLTLKEKQKQKKRSLLKRKIVGFVLFFLILTSIVVYLLYFSNFFKIKDISKLSLPETISNRSTLEQKLDGLKGKSILFLKLKNLEKEILIISPELESIALKKDYWQKKIILTFKLKSPFLVVCEPTESLSCCLADKNGFLFACGDELAFRDRDNLAKLLTENKILDQPLMKNILFLKTAVEDDQKIKIDFFEYNNENNETLKIKTSEGWLIYFNLKSDLDLSVNKLKTLFEEMPKETRDGLEYIDLRFNKAYYK